MRLLFIFNIILEVIVIVIVRKLDLMLALNEYMEFLGFDVGLVDRIDQPRVLMPDHRAHLCHITSLSDG